MRIVGFTEKSKNDSASIRDSDDILTIESKSSCTVSDLGSLISNFICPLGLLIDQIGFHFLIFQKNLDFIEFVRKKC